MTKESIAEKTRLPMAYDPKTFKDRVQEKLGGALGHFYMAHLAELNQQTRWVQHWKGEVFISNLKCYWCIHSRAIGTGPRRSTK